MDQEPQAGLNKTQSRKGSLTPLLCSALTNSSADKILPSTHSLDETSLCLQSKGERKEEEEKI